VYIVAVCNASRCSACFLPWLLRSRQSMIFMDFNVFSTSAIQRYVFFPPLIFNIEQFDKIGRLIDLCAVASVTTQNFTPANTSGAIFTAYAISY
jgi:hypothetical protein